MLGPVDRERTSECCDGSLAGRVGGLGRERYQRRLGCDVDDCPTALAQQRPECLAGLEGPEDVDLEVPPEVLDRELLDRLVLRQDARGVDQDVETIQPSHQRVERAAVGDIDGRVGLESDDLNGCPRTLQQPDACLADAGSSTRDDGDSALETVHAGHPIRLPSSVFQSPTRAAIIWTDGTNRRKRASTRSSSGSAGSAARPCTTLRAPACAFPESPAPACPT